MSDDAGRGLVERARDAAAQGDWQHAFDLLMEADADDLLVPTDLPVLGEVAYAAGHLDVTVEAWERAHAACMQAGDQVAAAGAAVRLAMHLLFDTALMAPVRGWLARAERLLEGHDQTPAHAWFGVVRAYERMLTGDMAGARQWARRAIDVGSRCDPAACAIGRVAEARLVISDGDVQQGLALLDEAGVATVSGELDPLSTGVVYCELVCALQGLALYDVAEQWTEAMERWCETNSIGSLHGRCRVHRAEILRLRGSCHDAQRQALMACEELRPYLRRAHHASGSEQRADLERQAARTILEEIEAAPTMSRQRDVAHHDALDEQSAATVDDFRCEGDYWTVIFDGPSASATSKACTTPPGSSPTRAGSSTCWTSSPPRAAALHASTTATRAIVAFLTNDCAGVRAVVRDYPTTGPRQRWLRATAAGIGTQRSARCRH